MRLVVVSAAVALLTVGFAHPVHGADTSPISISDPIRVGEGSIGVAIDASGSSAFAITELTSQLHRIDIASSKITQTVPAQLSVGNTRVPAGPRSIAMDDVRERVIVGSQSFSGVMEYESDDLSIVGERSLDYGGVSSVDTTLDGSIFLGTASRGSSAGVDAGRIVQVDSSTLAIQYQSPPLATSVGALRVDARAQMAFFIGNDAALRRLDMRTGEVQLVFPTINELVRAIDLDEQAGILYAAMESGVRLVDTTTLQVVETWSSVPSATAIALATKRDIAFIISQNRLAVVHIGSGEVVARDENVAVVAGYGNYLATNGVDPVAAFVDGSSWIRLASMSSIPPSPPTNVRVAPARDGLRVSWRKPTFMGYPGATRYVVRVSGSKAMCASARTSCTIRGLKPGRKYRLHVTAQSPQVQSLPSVVVTTTVNRPRVNLQSRHQMHPLA